MSPPSSRNLHPKIALGRPEGQFPGSLGWRSNSLGQNLQPQQRGCNPPRFLPKIDRNSFPNPPPPTQKKKTVPNLLLIFFVAKWCPLPKRLLYANPAGSFELICSKTWQEMAEVCYVFGRLLGCLRSDVCHAGLRSGFSQLTPRTGIPVGSF